MREHVTQSNGPGNAAAAARARNVQAPEAPGRLPQGALNVAKISPGSVSRRSSNATTVRSLLQLQRTRGNRYVQRALALLRQGDGESETAPEVESAIENVRGGGQHLDGGLQKKMESSFGTDFSGVRIHTGPDAHALNRAVNAVAFTTGQDIFFRDGAYNPAGSEGQELLAHELTHVVQQGGASPIPGQAQRFEIHQLCSECQEEKDDKLQHKLALGQPGDEYEREADRVAKSVTTMLGTSGVTAKSVADPVGALVQRAPAPAGAGTTPTPGGGKAGAQGSKTSTTESFPAGFIRLIPTVQRIDAAGSGPAVVINTPNQTVDLGTVTNGDRGFIRFSFSADWDFKNPGQGLEPAKGDAQLETLTPFRVPKELKEDDDKLKFSKTRPRLLKSEGTGASLDKQPSTSEDPDDLGGSVTVAPSITYQVQTASQVQGGFTVTVLFLSAGPQFAEQAAVNEVESISRAYTASLTFKAKPVPPPPSPKHYDCSESFGPFVVASDHFMQEDDSRQKIHDWYFGLDPAVRQDLELGKGVLRATGRASLTGSKTFNLDLAEKRAKRVRDIIADFAGSDAHFRSFALGDFGAQTQGKKKEDPNERRVDVEVTGDVPGDQAKGMQGDSCGGHKDQPTPTGPTGPVNTPEDITQPSVPAAGEGPQAAGPQGAAPSADGGAPSGAAAVASTEQAAAAPGDGGGSRDFEEAQSDVGSTAAAAQEPTALEPTAQQAVAAEEQPAEETAA